MYGLTLQGTKSIRLRFLRNPLWIIAALWPFVLLTPHLPGLPRPAMGGLPWRQEFSIALLLCVALAFIIKGASKSNSFNLSPYRSVLLLLASETLFIAWIWLSAGWAQHPFVATHLAFQWSAYLIFFALMIHAASRPKLWRASLFALGTVIWILGAACVIESWFGASLTDGNMRGNAKPIFRGSSGFGEIMAVAAPLFGALTLYLRRPRAALLCGATATLAWLAALQAMERAPLLGAVSGLALLFGGACLKKSCRPRSWLSMAVLAIALIITAALQTVHMPFGNKDRSGEPVSAISRLQVGFSEDTNTHARFLLWGIGWEMLRSSPLTGVGANNYEVAYPQGRAQFSARYPNAELVNINEELLAVYAHNEYIQILAELGVVGFTLFAIFCTILVLTFWRALKHKRAALPALGAGGGMLAFALSSGASASSFRYLGGGLVFFFAAALIVHIASQVSRENEVTERFFNFPVYAHRVVVASGALVLTLLMLCTNGIQASVSIMNGMAQATSDAGRVERLYQTSLRLNPFHAPTHYSYGMWLYSNGHASQAVSYLRYAAEHGFNSSICYAYLAEAEDEAGDSLAVVQTMAYAARVYPRSVFVRVRYAAALNNAGRSGNAETEYQTALALDSRQARGWWRLIRDGLDTAAVAAREDSGTALPGELLPAECVFAVLTEDDRRPPSVLND